MSLSRTILTVLFLYCSLGFSQTIPRIGMPHVQQYTKNEYKAGNQNWSLAVSPQGFVYAANTSGLLRFDGQQWHLYDHVNKAPLRSVNIASDGKIFTGGLGEFGFWTDKGFGTLNYTSLTPLVQDIQALKNDEIWRIIIDEDEIYFHSFSKAYVYRNNEVKTIVADGEPFMFSHSVRGTNYFEKLHSGLHVYDGHELIPVHDKQVLQGKNILCMLPYVGGKVLIGTSKDGLYLMDGNGRITPWANDAQTLFRRAQINTGVQINDHLYAFGTIQDGVIILNSKGELIQHLNKNNTLQNNTVLSICVDKQSNLWVGLDNGIDRIDIHSPFYYYSDLSGLLGTVYTSAIYQDKIYLGTNQGLFVSPWNVSGNHSTLRFSKIPNSDGQVWQLNTIGGILYCGHNNGTYRLDNDRLHLVSSFTGGWNLFPLSGMPYILQGNYTGLSLFDTSPPYIQHILQFPNIKEPVKFIAEKDPQTYWIGNNIDLKLVQLSTDLKQLNILQDKPQGFPLGRFYGIYKLSNMNVFATDSGFYRYDDALQSFTVYDEFNDQLGSFRTANQLKHIKEDTYWVFKQSRIAQIDIQRDGGIRIDSTTWNPLAGRMMNEYENILRISDSVDLIGLDNGFALYTHGIKEGGHFPPPVITGFWNITGDQPAVQHDPKIPFRRNNVRISFSVPWYGSSPARFQYRLDGYVDHWTDWDVTAYKDFTNLSYGDYTFQLRAISPTGTISDVTELPFTIGRPWYWSWIAICFYAMAIAVAYYLARKWYYRRLARQREAVTRRMQAEQREALARESERSERELITLKNEKLERELAIKSRELANSAMNIVYKNEMLNNLHDELTKIKDSNGKKLNKEQLLKVNKLIDEAHSDDRDWNLFEESFNDAHESFFKKLKVDYPDLVPNDLKLCAYLRLNMSSKEIASLLNITLRGVEIRRYRLRKKLNLPTTKNLTEFLLEL